MKIQVSNSSDIFSRASPAGDVSSKLGYLEAWQRHYQLLHVVVASEKEDDAHNEEHELRITLLFGRRFVVHLFQLISSGGGHR
jgi:hypothetical protein